jgi:hypothetical protein
MTHCSRRALAVILAGAGLAVSAASQAWAWGHTGHVGISQIAILDLPAELPAFLRTAQSAAQIAELGAEADESKTTGAVTAVTNTGRIQTTLTVHDAERDPGHYIDLTDTGYVLGGAVSLFALPATREAFDTAQRGATSPAGQDQYSAGYLPYTIIDGFQQVRKDFGMWRVLTVGLNTATNDADRAYFRLQLQLRQQLIIRDIGYWSHFVADASQPMHVSVHFNGWGNYPNPNNYTTAPIHAPFEGSFVRSFVSFNTVIGQVRPYTDRGVTSIEQRVPLYLAETLAQLVPVYATAQAAGNDNYQAAQPAEVALVTQQLAAGASELRDEIVDAWRQSTSITVGFPLVQVSAAEAGMVRITPTTFGAD